jgi:hypothetical protein
MTLKLTPATLVTGALLACSGWNIAAAQAPGMAPGDTKAYVGRVYTLHTARSGECPSLDWQIVVGENNTLSGLIGADDMKTVFRVAGSFNRQSNTFQLAGAEIGGNRPGAVNGKLQSDGLLAASLGGLPLGAACQGKTVYVHWVSPQETAGGVAG